MEDAMRRAVALVLLASIFCSSSAGGAGAGVSERARRRLPRQTLLSSSWSSGICLNGGTSVPSLTTGRHMFCLCTDAFEGTFCQTGENAREGPGHRSRLDATRLDNGGQKGSGCYLCNNSGSFPGGFRRRLLRGRGALLPRRPIPIGERSPVRALGRRHQATLPELGRGRRETQLLQERALQAPPVVPRVEGAAADLGILPRSFMRLAATVGVGSAHRGPRHHTCSKHSPPAEPPVRVGHVRASFSPQADAYRGRSGGAGGVAAVASRHPVARQVQREGLPLRGQLDRPMLGPQRRSLLPRRQKGRKVPICFGGRARTNERRFLVALGKSALNRSETLEQIFRVDKIILHPDFDNERGNYDNDMALLKLTPKANGRCARKSAGVRQVCLPTAEGRRDLPAGFPCEIAGFGKEKHGLWYHSQLLRQAHVNLLDAGVCGAADYYGDKITDNMLCAGREDWTQDACEGDSGGPLACQVDGRFVVVGVVSWGEGCARQRRPGVYAKVRNYRQWIRQHAGV